MSKKREVMTQGMYKNRLASSCPFCRSSNSILTSERTQDGSKMYQETTCENCGAQWRDWFEFDHYSILRYPAEEGGG